jgi:hypothetical protein
VDLGWSVFFAIGTNAAEASMRSIHLLLLMFLVGSLTAAVHCAGVPVGSGDPGVPDGSNDGPQGCDPFCDGGLATSITIVPPTATLVVDDIDGVPTVVPTQQFKALANTGEDVTAQVTWLYDHPQIGAVSTVGTFTPVAKNNVGGLGTIIAKLGAISATADLTVKVTNTLAGAVSPGDRMKLDGSSTPDTAKIVYPEDQTFFPQGLLGPEIQWNGASQGDLYKLELKDKNAYYDYVEYFASSSSHALADIDWTSLSASTGGAKNDPFTVTLTRLSNNSVYSQTQTWGIAQGTLKGNVYPWSIPSDQVIGPGYDLETAPTLVARIKPGETQNNNFFTVPVNWSPAPKPYGVNCWGCHSVSRDGTKMVVTFNGGWGTPYGGYALALLDLKTDPPTPIFAPSAATYGGYGVFNDKGDKIAYIYEGQQSNSDPHLTGINGWINIMDTKGNVLAKDVFKSAQNGGCSEPTWSPDGKHMAAMCKLNGGNCNNGWFFECPNAEMWIADTSGSTLTNHHMILQQTNVGSKGRMAFPDYSSDSNWLVFEQLQPNEEIMGVSQLATDGQLWLTDTTGKNVMHLANASKGTDERPAFAPLRAGGYHWVVFMSRRNYGNKLVGKSQPQLWITAVDDPPTGDPSHPAFYVRGQDIGQDNMSLRFSLPPCKDDGKSCSAGSDCCNGKCLNSVCGNDANCSTSGNKCSTASDCCDAKALCEDGFCTVHIN